MANLKCPACGESIPSDSKYCDMCGEELLQCVACGALGTSEDVFCPDCGKPMVSRKTSGGVVAEPVSEPKPEPVEDEPEGHTTGAARRRPKKLILRYRKGNAKITPSDGAVIGRQEGPYQDIFEGMPDKLVSRRHGRFEWKGGEWYIVDFGSTNGCGVNDVLCDKNVPMRFSAGDVVDIATYLFDVEEA